MSDIMVRKSQGEALIYKKKKRKIIRFVPIFLTSVFLQEEPEDLSDSSHPSIVPLNDAPPIPEFKTPKPGLDYITVHYSRLSR